MGKVDFQKGSGYLPRPDLVTSYPRIVVGWSATSTSVIQAQRLVDPVNGRLGALDICPDTTRSAYRSSP
jgi:hypothetical protein